MIYNKQMSTKMHKIILTMIFVFFTSSAYSGNHNSEYSKFISPDQAFKIQLQELNSRQIRISWDIEDGYYLYMGMFSFTLDDDSHNSINKISMPAGQKKVDEFFGEVDIYKKYVGVDIYFEKDINNLNLKVNYQGCAEAGLCYPPIKKVFHLNKTSSDENFFQKTSLNLDQLSISKQLYEKSLVVNIILFFFGGLLLAFTPCVFPMIPILTGLIVGQGNDIGSKKAFKLSLTYVIAMSITYSLLGILVALSGSNIQANLQNPYVIGLFSALFVMLALAMLGLIKIEMPKLIQNKLAQTSNKNTSGSYYGVGIMGALSALIVGPCVTAPLIGALIYIASSGDVVIGGLALFFMGLGMGTPLLVLGTSASKLTKSIGIYLPIINRIFGILFLIVAIWLIERIVSIQISGILWALLALLSTTILFFNEDLRAINKTLRLSLISILLSYSFAQVIGVYKNSNFEPYFSIVEKSKSVEFKVIYKTDDLNKYVLSSDKITMVDLYADWCVACKELEKYTFTNQNVRKILDGMNLIKFDITESTQDSDKFLNDYKLFGPPAILFFNTDGDEYKEARIVGFVDANEFIEKYQRTGESVISFKKN